MASEQEEDKGMTSAGTNSAWMRRHLSDSIYLWACGEKADDEDDDPNLSDRLIGWLILFMQGFAYTMLIVLARATAKSDIGSSADDSEDSRYLLPSVTGAMYLLVASTTHDLRAGYSLLVDGLCAGHRAFGIGLLTVYGAMISAAMTVLVSTSDDSAAVVLNAVTVLFVAELDEKALKLFSMLPQKWRLFWAIESIGMSFALAVVAIYYIGDDSPLLEGNNGILTTFPTWFVWALNPAGVTLCSVVLTSTVQAACEFCSEASQSVDEPTLSFMVSKALTALFSTVKRAKERFRGQPCFYFIQGVWLTQGVGNWFYFKRTYGYPMAFNFEPASPSSEETRLVLTDNVVVLLYVNAILVAGVAAKAMTVFLPRHDRVTAVSEPRLSSEGIERREGRVNCADSRVPSLLVGWGVGYWVTSLFYVLACSWHGGGCGWTKAPTIVSVIGYVVIPCFLLTGVFMVADTNILGTRVGTVFKPTVDSLRNMSRVEYWIMATAFRDILVVWIGWCDILSSPLDYYV